LDWKGAGGAKRIVKTKKTGESGVENGKEKKTRDIQMAKALGDI
jgi:hypothetical protein